MSSDISKKKTNDTSMHPEAFLDNTLRPSSWETYIGQNHIKENLHILLTAAQARNQPAEHVLFYGPPGLGKTTLAHLIAKETGRAISTTSGPAIEKVGDLASILTNLSDNDILFIDEIHRLNKTIEEVLYPAMESGVLDIIIGKGPSARTVQLDLPPFTLIAATTRMSMLSSPLRSRFGGGVFRLEYYTDNELSRIIENSSHTLGFPIDTEGALEISKRARKTPRTANYLLKRARDYAEVHNLPFSKDTVDKALSLLAIDELGLTEVDRKYLYTLKDSFKGGPAGLKTISASIGEDSSTVEEVLEPFLLQIGFIEKQPRGRVLTKEALDFLS
ncbi:MAG: Holliday junction DNA helicase RuvB [Flavobacteriaceae bacterium]|jgi:Holliday junction DNA helicase RuvB